MLLCCTGTGKTRIKRSDDNEEALKQRHISYYSMTTPLVSSYTKSGLHHKIDVVQSSDEVFHSIIKAFSKCHKFCV